MCHKLQDLQEAANNFEIGRFWQVEKSTIQHEIAFHTFHKYYNYYLPNLCMNNVY